MTPKHKKFKYIPPGERVYAAIGRPPLEVHTPIGTTACITLHYDESYAEAEVDWQRRMYGRTAVIVRASK